MTKFTVGDRVKLNTKGDSNDLWNGVKGTIVTIRGGIAVLKPDEGSTYADGKPLHENYIRQDAGGWSDDSYDLIEPSELEQLRQFKVDAIAKYPDLAPMSDEDKVVLELINKHGRGVSGINRDYIDLIEASKARPVITTIIRAAIQWGRDHAN